MRLSRKFILIVLLLSAVTLLGAQAPQRGNAPAAPARANAPAAARAATAPHLKGRVTDSSGAVIPGSSVKVMQGTKVVSEVMTNDTGDFDVELAAGDYQIEVTSPDFKAFKQNVRVAANMAPLAIPMTLEILATVVDVTDVNEEVSIDSASSLSEQTIAGSALADLPDNEDDLAQYLQDLASTSGAAGSQAAFVIDGFSGGRLPPKDQIQQIIIDTNPFSADSNGGTRIQIITRAGTGNWTGQFGGNFSDSALNAATPAALTKPARRQKTFNATSGGPIIPKLLTMTFTGQNTETDAEGTSVRAFTAPGQTVSQGVLSPSTRRNIGARGQMYITKAHTLNFNGTYGTNKSLNQGVGGFNLPERASNTAGHNWQVQLSERFIPKTSIINEFRFQANQSNNSTSPVTNAIAVNVNGAFNSGGGQNSNQSSDRTYELGNTLRWTLSPKLQIQSGIELDYEKRHSVSQNNFLGTYTFASLDDYIANRPTTFTRTSGNPLLDSKQYDFNTFIQADWRVVQKVSIGLGARYIAQSNLSDRNNLAPTLSVAIQASKNTVIRGGGRVSYQAFSLNNTENILRNAGAATQTTLSILSPTYVAGQIPPEALAAAATGSNNGSIYLKASNLEAPYNMNAQFSVDHSFGLWRVSNSFDVTRGLHVIRQRNINAPFPGTPLSDDLLARLNDPATKTAARAEVDALRPYFPFIGNMNQYESSGMSLSRNWTVTLNTPMNVLHIWKVGFGGRQSYTYGVSRDNAGTAPNQYDWSTEWAHSQNDQRHRFQGNMNFRFPRSATISFNFNASAGRPYNVTTGKDLNGDQSTNDRPAGLGRNTGTAPSTYNVNMTFTKIFFLKRKANATRGNDLVSSFAEPQRGGGGGGGFGGGQQGGGQRGGAQQGGQQQRQNQTPTGPQLTFNANFTNLLNNTQVRGISGVQTSPLFGKPTNFAGGRSVVLGLNMRF